VKVQLPKGTSPPDKIVKVQPPPPPPVPKHVEKPVPKKYELVKPIRLDAKPFLHPEGKEKEKPLAKEKEKPLAKEKEKPSTKEKEKPPPKEKEKPPPKEKEKPPVKEKEKPPPKEKEKPPAKEKEKPPAKEKEKPPAKEKEEPSLLLAVRTGITESALRWFASSPALTERQTDITLTDPDALRQDGGPVLGKSLPSPKYPKTDTPVTVEKMTKDWDDFQQRVETRFKAMDRNLEELKAKAKHGRAVTKEQMNEAIDALNTKTEAAREELRALRTAPLEHWDALKTGLNASLEELKDGFDRTFSRFMTEWARGRKGHKVMIAGAMMVVPGRTMVDV
jgi:hypothetical protein